jgi:hypothetical protein
MIAISGLSIAICRILGALLLAAREAVVQVTRRELLVHLERGHVLLHEVAEFLRGDALLRRGLAVLAERRRDARVERGAQERAERQAGDRDRVLERHEQAGTGALVGLHLEDRLTLEQDVARGDLVLAVAHERVRERALARAVRAHDRVHLALVHRERQALQDLLALHAHVEVLHHQITVHRVPSIPARGRR